MGGWGMRLKDWPARNEPEWLLNRNWVWEGNATDWLVTPLTILGALAQLLTIAMSEMWIQYVGSECTYVFTAKTGDPVGWFSCRLKLESSRDSIISTTTILRAGLSVVRILAGLINVFLSKRLDQRYSLHIYWEPGCFLGTGMWIWSFILI
jgi:hypothetical protein